jgi:hypothetical protein
MARIVIVILINHHQKPIDSITKFTSFYLKYTNHVVTAVREIIAVCYDNHSKNINENSEFWMLNQVVSMKTIVVYLICLSGALKKSRRGHTL